MESAWIQGSWVVDERQAAYLLGIEDADSYWRLRAFWAGRQYKRSATNSPKRCPDRCCGIITYGLHVVGY